MNELEVTALRASRGSALDNDFLSSFGGLFVFPWMQLFVFPWMQNIILKLIEHYPQQSLWMMMAVVKVTHWRTRAHGCTHIHSSCPHPTPALPQSTHKDRQSRCQRILSKAKSSNAAVEKQITVS